MRISNNLKKSLLPIMGVALITSVLAANIGYKNGLLIGIGMILIVEGLIKAVVPQEDKENDSENVPK